jgi:hypothetical protein
VRGAGREAGEEEEDDDERELELILEIFSKSYRRQAGSSMTQIVTELPSLGNKK